ncbi:MAG: putative metal-dependent phosphohydrolase [bacterium P3]|nr:MAG: putative metal-dependent phosphohydrolase [bacterium P3]KWW42204.1 MAG: putative metal-dependent phosphohydrolase [bacterium F083]
MTNKRKIINDPVYGFLTIEDEIIFDIISHPYFQRERRIAQLGFTTLVYPCATHTRFSHMLGALSLMNRAIEVLRVKGVEIGDEEALGVKLAILLHDIGHGPFSHISEHVLADVDHEVLTLLFMERLNEEFHGALTMAIDIFTDSYRKHFLHQLVSSQLDMDRLDYLSRDSYFTGVCEGIVGTERIINMLNVHDDELVVDEKGIYSIEKFIISRRLMYWQVYMHKTVIVADNLLLSILRRARQTGASSHNESLDIFLRNHVREADFRHDASLLDRFARLDDSDITVAVKGWMQHDDVILRTLSTNLICRHLGAIRVSNQPFASEVTDGYRQQVQQRYGIDPQDSDYFVNTGILRNHAYDFNDQEIKVLYKGGECRDISEASDQLDRRFLEKQVTKYYLFHPKEIRLDPETGRLG